MSPVISIHLMFLLIGRRSEAGRAGSCISIHLMFLLIALRQSDNRFLKHHFNTSHVSINPALRSWYSLPCTDFNTSHVSINHRLPELVMALPEFQYISCFY